ncbi:MAG: hypothetical protein KIS67_03090 [Verrucomicrobiae bacterium]|nr:hypothetical protein [Verrucomicrobiae bacterium]
MTTSPAASGNESSARPKPANLWTRRLRKWHSVLGMVAAIFLLVIGGTGIYLNHKPFSNPCHYPQLLRAFLCRTYVAFCRRAK